MNRTDKPKMTSKALVDKLRDEKGVSFKYVTEDNAEKYLAQINNYLRTASYCKLRLNGTPVPLLRNGYSIFNGTKYR